MRKGRAKKRPILPDPKFGDKVVSRFVNGLMYDGKKSLAYKIFYDALDIVEKKNQEEPSVDIWRKALENVMPTVEVKARRVGGATFQIPTEVPAHKRVTVGMRWMISYARKRNEKSMAEKLAGEILQAFKNEGSSVKKKEDTHKMADANKAFAHFRA
jgi:small subunit ribosomal protein S7